jgi:phosphotransacetylase/acyl dehydratase
VVTQKIRNTTWDELKVGDSADIERSCSQKDLYLFAHVSGNTNPLMLPDGSAPTGTEQHRAVAPSMWVGSLVSAVLGNLLPGPGTLYLSQNLRFHARVKVGDRLTASVRCIEKKTKPVAVFETKIVKDDGTLVSDGLAEVEAPQMTIETEPHMLPGLILDEEDHFKPLIERAKQLPALRTAIVCPDDRNSLGGAVLSAREGLIIPILIGSRQKILDTARDLSLDITAFELQDVAEPTDAARKAVAMVNEGAAQAIMKGNIHSDELLAQVVKKEGGLRGNRRISHVFVMDAPTLDHLLFISDAAINIAPDLMTKVDITQNAIDVALASGVREPLAGILSAVETVNPNIPSTLDAAILSKMAERGQIKGGIVDGPLAMDNAMDITAAHTKGIVSIVAGRANVLIVPNLESGNMLVKELTFVARAEAAGIVVGAKAPVMLTSRADNDRARLASCALALLYEYWRRTGKAFTGSKEVAKAAE